jgi:hypothetical protein
MILGKMPRTLYSVGGDVMHVHFMELPLVVRTVLRADRTWADTKQPATVDALGPDLYRDLPTPFEADRWAIAKRVATVAQGRISNADSPDQQHTLNKSR